MKRNLCNCLKSIFEEQDSSFFHEAKYDFFSLLEKKQKRGEVDCASNCWSCRSNVSSAGGDLLQRYYSFLTTNALAFPVVVDFFPNGRNSNFMGRKKRFSLLFFWGKKILHEDLVWVPLKLFGQFVF